MPIASSSLSAVSIPNRSMQSPPRRDITAKSCVISSSVSGSSPRRWLWIRLAFSVIGNGYVGSCPQNNCSVDSATHRIEVVYQCSQVFTYLIQMRAFNSMGVGPCGCSASVDMNSVAAQAVQSQDEIRRHRVCWFSARFCHLVSLMQTFWVRGDAWYSTHSNYSVATEQRIGSERRQAPFQWRRLL